MGFPRQEYCSGVPFPSPGDLPDSRIEPASPASLALASGFFTTMPPEKFSCTIISCLLSLTIGPQLLNSRDLLLFTSKSIPSSSSQSLSSVQSLSHVRLFVTPWTAARQASLSITNSRNLFKLISIELVIPSNHLILCHPLLLPPSIFPSIRVFSNKSALCIRWPKYWGFSFSIISSSDYSGLISFRMDWLDILAVQGTLEVFSNTTVQKHQFFGTRLSL